MRTIHTKQGRIDSQNVQFAALIAADYTHTTHAGLNIFTSDKDNILLLKVFTDNSSNQTVYTRHRTVESRSVKIETVKANYDRFKAYKAEAKATKTVSGHAGAAAGIRAELKKAFPSVKFTVRSKSFAGGDSVHIEWTDECTTDQVKKISDKYQYGSFNGMEDIYENTNNRADLPQAKYVSENRDMSDTKRAEIIAILRIEYGAEHFDDLASYEQSRYIYRVFNTSDYSNQLQPEAKNSESISTQAQEVIREEWDKMQDFINTTDEGEKEAKNSYKEPEVKEYTSVKDISEAANSGQVISLCNLFTLVQSEWRVK